MTVGRVVDEARGTHVSSPRELDRLGGRQVAALVVVVAGVAQARLDQQEIGAAREVGDRVARPGIAGVDEACAIGRFDGDRPRRHVMATRGEADRQRPDRRAASGEYSSMA